MTPIGGTSALRASHRPAQASAPLDVAGVAWLVGLTMLWGVNALTVKVVVQGMSPLMATGLRGALALAILTGYGLWRGERLTYRGRDLVHGTVNGLVFALEFVFIYGGAPLTTAGHIAIFINTAPFFVALGAHYLLPGDRLSPAKVAGLLLALTGIAVMFSNEILLRRSDQWRGDFLLLIGAALWGANTVYAKRCMVGHMSSFRILYVQLVVSTPVLLSASWAFERHPFFAVTGTTLAMVVFQAVAAVSFSYMAWLALMRRYSASAMQSFTFLTPAWGVLLGIILLGEAIQAAVLAGIALVGLGIYLVNRPPRRRTYNTARSRPEEQP